jgi:hypothetical protein
MRRIRRSKSISSKAVITATKAAPTVVQEFEETALMGNPVYNRVYLRLFVRGYAEVIGIRSEDALRAVEEVLGGQYQGSLARLYLEEDEDTSAPPPGPPPVAAAPPPASEAPAAELPDASPSVTAAPDPPPTKPAPASPPAAPAPPPATPAPPPATPASPPATPASPPATPAPPPATPAPPPATPRSPAILVPGGWNPGRWLGVILAAGAVAAAAWFFWPEAARNEPPPPVARDTVQARAPVLPPRVILADTVSFFVIAARDTLNPFRATVDGGTRTPYWIELLDSLEFRVTNQIVLERRLQAMDVSVRGVLVPTDKRDDLGRLVLSRQGVQAYLDSLRTTGGLPGA